MANDLVIRSLRGGMNDTDLPANLPDDQCAEALNVEFWLSALGERRLGCAPLALTGSGLDAQNAVVLLAERFPDNDIFNPEWWAFSGTVNGAIVMALRLGGVWFTHVPIDAPVTTAPEIYRYQSQALNGKLFFAYPSAQDRLHVWDGVTVRRTGVAQPGAAPTAADFGVGTYSTVRYFRVRFIQKSGSTVLRRSEPSDALTFTPAGTGSGAHITQPTPVGEGETHWEVEASTDNAIFYRIATVQIATTTYNDTTNLSTQTYPSQGPVSEAIGTYLLLPSARFIAADADRLLLGGHWTDATKQSRVAWTPVFADPGAGNDERLPLATGGDNYVDLDNYEGGALTGISQISNGTWYAFKWGAIYKLSRTGDITHAYDPVCITKKRGALPGSIVAGVDAAGRACVYFTDPSVGPCVIGAGGLQEIEGLRDTWKRVTITDTGIGVRSLYYPEKKQVHWWVPVDGSSSPTLKLVLQTNEMHTNEDGGLRGSFALADGLLASATAVGTWHEATIEGGISKVRTRPFIGLAQGASVTSQQILQRADMGDDDNGVAYHAHILTRPYILAGLLNQWGALTASVLASAGTAISLLMSCVRDFGLESTTATVALDPTASEAYVFRNMDDLSMSESTAIQFRFEDTT